MFMSLLDFFFGCFIPKSGSKRTSTDGSSNSKVLALDKPKSNSKCLRAPIIVSHFPVRSNLSLL
ncbi:hypothetical protein BRARA_A00280 [Brassica rapa]|nr:uncharacterized protein LOC103874981 [Brassica rapa]XP_048634586.1 uncharacterized protein LOC106370238 [Brassica napus]RID77358.1 hypothetical protein BRARA_A00280 [Brassica rapa]VDC73786.1 unnamed protein product [Brassica rapa]